MDEMTDLDALERAFDQAEEIPFVRMPTLRRVVAELRASRKVVEAAIKWDRIEAQLEAQIAIHYNLQRRPEVAAELRNALAELSTINVRREEGK